MDAPRNRAAARAAGTRALWNSRPRLLRPIEHSRGRLGHVALLAAVLLVAMGAQQRSPNFIVETPDPGFARQVAAAAEQYRHDLAIAWLGRAMPNWSQPCVMSVQVAPYLGAGGATTFQFQDGEVFGWRMTIQGSAERILDSVLPHEVTHMVFASHFRQPLPRWADEGGATTVENIAEKNKYRQLLDRYLRTGYGIAFNQMFAMTEYPQDTERLMALYSEGYSVAQYLIQNGGRRRYIAFLGDGLKGDDWPGAVRRYYGYADLGALQDAWLGWVKQGSPLMKPPEERPAAAGLMADSGRRPMPAPNLIYHVPNDRRLAATITPVATTARDAAGPWKSVYGTGEQTENDSRSSVSNGALARASVPTPGPAVEMVPVALPDQKGTVPFSLARKSGQPPPFSLARKSGQSPLRWVDPSRAPRSSREEAVASDARPRPAAASAAGWHAPGEPAPPPAEQPSTEVARPQPVEQP